MAPLSSCPRCQTVVSYEEGTKPRCHNCGYPGADTRQAPATAPAAASAPAPSSGPSQGQWTQYDAPSAPASAQMGEARTSGKAVAALVLGIASYVVGGIITAIIGIILAVSARKEIDESGGAVEGRGMAVAGFWLCLVNIILGVIVLLIFLFIMGAGIAAAGAAASMA